MKRYTVLLMLLSMVLFPLQVYAGGTNESSPEEESVMELRYAHSNVPAYFYHTAGLAFAEEVERLTNGMVKIKLYPQGQLGGERDVTEALQLGAIDFQASSIGVTGTFVPSIQILNLPFLFTGPKHWMAVMNGPVGKELLERAQKEGERIGLKVLAIAAPDFRLPMNNVRPIKSIDDFKGLKIRTMQVPEHMEAYKALGSDPVPLAFGELYTALQTKVVDGCENGPLALLGNRFYEVQKYLVILPVVSNGGILLMSKETFDKMSKSQQEAVLKAVDTWKQVMDRDALEKGGAAIEEMKAKGLEVTTVDDLTSFIEATAPVYENFFNKLEQQDPELASWAREMIAKIRATSKGIVEGDWYANY
ncbi:TRAP dicarboxylate transporter, DctP subunit [Spirochaeta thermophila DSM 6578]|uniref:TRAP dicarboxylate transporter, DctP subunit n=1 Tax=Winmispira thermophila (strain ATCC 700085 / DSM 6578 / Z-1203) TaxID=869211 RepID=G0GBA3_WINT7|nr:TRAP transporter substrate-binding protein [Spirochaeta thermophila]AEJ61912.1 TRAP dicarboxylate transporter, DctP subunit [Spirochaeta thermophila DSM 6578]